MGTISFSDFAKTLRSHLSNGENGPAFTQTLFENITDFDDVDSNPVYQKSDHTFKKYLSGDTNIATFASSIRDHIDESKFANWLETANPESLEEARKDLAQYLPTSDTYEFPEACARLFSSIIKESSPDIEITQIAEKELPFQIDYATETENASLRDECLNKCLLCGKRLKTLAKVQIVPPKLDYKERAILRDLTSNSSAESLVPDFDNHFDFDSPDNKALLTIDCAADYENSFTIEKCARLMANKLKAKRRHAAQLIMDGIDLDDALRNLLDSLDQLIDPRDVEVLHYKPVKVKDKILPETHILKAEIDGLVNNYYGFIKNELGRRDGNDEFDTEDLCMSVRKCYKILNKAGESQDHIYDMMAHWISDNTGSNNCTACRVMIAFFVQNCEVFDEIPE